MSDGKTISTRNDPTDVVNFKINLNGTALNGEYKVVGLYISKSYNKISSAKIMIADGDAASQDFPISSKEDGLLPGAEIDISIGYHAKTRSVFKGIITKQAIKSGRSKHSFLTIEAKDKAVKLTIARKSHCFVDKKDSEIIESVIKKSGVGASVDIDSTPVQHKEMVQYNVTDWDFIVSRADLNGMLVFTDNNKITVKTPDTSQEAAKEITYGVDILEFESEIDGVSQLNTVISHAWNFADQEVADSSEGKVDFKENGNVKSSSLASAFGGEYHLYHSGNLAKQELKTWSDAKLLKSRFAKSVGRIKLKGTSEINIGEMVKLNGFGKRVNGSVLITGIRHNYNESIWETDLQFGLSDDWFSSHEDLVEKPAAGVVPGVNGLQIGVAVQLENDPENQNRVKIKLPLVDTQEGIWARIASLDAGKDRGSFFLPEIGDEVIVGFINDDPRHPVILGMLHSNSKAAPLNAQDTNHEKGFVTRSKMKFVFNDDKKSVLLETPKGKKIGVDDDGDTINLTDNHNNKITMGADGILIESAKDIILKTSAGDVKVDGMNIEVKAAAKLGAQSNAQTEVKSSGITIIKGSMVNIN